MLEIGLKPSSRVPQLFYKMKNEKLVLIVAKIVDDLKAAGEDNRAKEFMDKFDKTFKFGDIKHVPGKLCFFGINTVQNGDLTIEKDADDKMDAVPEYPFSRQRRKQYDQALMKSKDLCSHLRTAHLVGLALLLLRSAHFTLAICNKWHQI